jgi:hypothetical protein
LATTPALAAVGVEDETAVAMRVTSWLAKLAGIGTLTQFKRVVVVLGLAVVRGLKESWPNNVPNSSTVIVNI